MRTTLILLLAVLVSSAASGMEWRGRPMSANIEYAEPVAALESTVLKKEDRLDIGSRELQRALEVKAAKWRYERAKRFTHEPFQQ